MLFNILYYLKNLIFKWEQTPKEITNFTCPMCENDFKFPITSKDYLLCNKCFPNESILEKCCRGLWICQ